MIECAPISNLSFRVQAPVLTLRSDDWSDSPDFFFDLQLLMVSLPADENRVTVAVDGDSLARHPFRLRSHDG